MRFGRHVAVAAVTAVSLGSFTSAILPSTGSPPTPEPASSSQFADTHQRDVGTLRRNGTILQDAINGDELTPAELRPAEDDAAGDAVRELLLRP